MRNILAASVLAGMIAVAAFADAPKGAKEEIVKEGQLVCVGCHLQKEHGADAQCTLYAKHAQGLLASDGTLWTLIDNTRGHAFVTDKKLAGKPIRIHGWAFPKTQVLEIHRYDLQEGGKWAAYDYCKTCGWEPGDHKGKDLCEDCESGK